MADSTAIGREERAAILHELQEIEEQLEHWEKYRSQLVEIIHSDIIQRFSKGFNKGERVVSNIEQITTILGKVKEDAHRLVGTTYAYVNSHSRADS